MYVLNINLQCLELIHKYDVNLHLHEREKKKTIFLDVFYFEREYV